MSVSYTLDRLIDLGVGAVHYWILTQFDVL